MDASFQSTERQPINFDWVGRRTQEEGQQHGNNTCIAILRIQVRGVWNNIALEKWKLLMEAYRKVLSRPFYRGLSQASVFGEYINVVQKPQESSLEGSSLGLFFSCDIWQNKLNPKRKKDIELCGTARDDKISVRPVKSITASERLQTQWITCTDATRFIMEKCPSECKRKEPKCKGRRPVEGTGSSLSL